MKGSVLEVFGRRQIKQIEDITDFVKEQKNHVDNHELDKLSVPIETVYHLADEDLRKRIGVD
jgi:hypothetical protein